LELSLKEIETMPLEHVVIAIILRIDELIVIKEIVPYTGWILSHVQMLPSGDSLEHAAGALI
jgi:hypothetical protein